MEIPFLSKKHGSIHISSFTRFSPANSLLIRTDTHGVITALRPKVNCFGFDEGFMGRNISEIYANTELPVRIQDMLAEDVGLSEFKRLISVENGILGIHGLSNGRLAYDAVIKGSEDYCIARVVKKAIRDEEGRIVGFTSILNDVTEKYSHKKELITLQKNKIQIPFRINYVYRRSGHKST